MDPIFIECFGGLEDPRVERSKKHLLLDIIGVAICAVIAGAEGWEEIEDFGCAHIAWFSGFLTLENGMPSHDTIARVFSALNPRQFDAASVKWLKEIKALEPETVIAIDGKTLRGSARKRSKLKGLHIVNAWSCANGISLGQLKVADKSNEITAVPEILKQLAIKGAIVTLDAMGCQQETITAICEAEADYMISLKGNQGDLFQGTQDSFKLAASELQSTHIYTAENKPPKAHGRIEERKIEVLNAKDFKALINPRWRNLNSLIRISSKRTENAEHSHEARYYISSLPCEDPLTILKAARSHWQIENCLHWALDVSFREDNSRVRDENAAINLASMRKVALGLLKKETTFKASIRRKQRRAAANTDYLSVVIAGI